MRAKEKAQREVGGQWALLIGVPTVDGRALVGMASFAHLGLPELINNLSTGQRAVLYFWINS